MIAIESNEELENAIIGFTVNSIRGVKVFAGNTFLDTKKAVKITKERLNIVIFEFQMPNIHSGKYIISPAVAIGTQDSHQMLAWYHSASIFTMPDRKNEIAFLNVKYNSNLYVL